MRALEEKTNFSALQESFALERKGSSLDSLRAEAFQALSSLQKPNLKHSLGSIAPLVG